MTIFPLRLIPATPNIDFMRLRWVSVLLSLALTIGSIAAIAGIGFNYALDFTGGTVVELRFEQAADVDGVRERLEAAGYGSAQVQTYGSGSDLLVRLQPRDGETSADANARTAEEVRAAASADGNEATIQGNAFVGPQVGRELAWNGLYALLFVVVGFLIYIGFRFEWKFAVAAIVTTLNDVLIVAGFFAVTGREFDLTVLAGLLSVMGFSINDTIVVFDRVRENFRSMRAPPHEVLNASINQTLSRTIITSVAAFLTVFALYLYGGGSLQGMSSAMMIGIVFGTLSSIFAACPLLTMGFLKVTKQDLLPKARDDEELARRP
ncbi:MULTISPECIES: protein translocase subunit SecF [unclassified Luteimonas]|uniref:protein translocase subunit SecF n=1 Tax=unclassified Luteimonas TaxID=2629088 RepID=UPI0016042234|nr:MULTISPECIES: protein translocase subunit SecF [unclassified Luteimonas]MBB1472158.1 protein translocase subunit SecF [Luteimonas sp. MC1782]MBB6599115.1 protein translocase subunit SecF [Luteimonas sp. MC1825]QOC89241.1 protein translocase subunit SecF [Luteimonas sp. MC1825]